MSEVAETRIGSQHIHEETHVLRNEEHVENVKNINGIRIDGVIKRGSSGWLLAGAIPDDNGDSGKEWDVVVKLALDPRNDRKATDIDKNQNDSGLRYERSAQLLQEANKRTVFAPLYLGHGVTEIPGFNGEFPYTVMEHIKGRSLEEIMDDQTLDPQEVLNILKTVATGVDELLGEPDRKDKWDGKPNKNAFISRDIKPSNIMMRESGRPVLIDFDDAVREGDQTQTEDDRIRGSLAYCGPDLVRKGTEVTRKLNTWQMGAIAFEMLTNEKFMNIDLNEKWFAAVMNFEDKNLYAAFLERRLNEVDLSDEAKRVLEKALADNPEDRQSSSTELVTELREAYKIESGFSRRKGFLKSTFDRVAHYIRRPKISHESQIESADISNSEENSVEIPSTESITADESQIAALESMMKEPSNQEQILKSRVLQRRTLQQKLSRAGRSDGHEERHRDSTRPDSNRSGGRHRVPSGGRHRITHVRNK